MSGIAETAQNLGPSEDATPLTEAPPPIEILASIAERITFASEQNHVAIIADLVIRNNTTEALENVELFLECAPALVSSKVWKIDRILPGRETRIRDRSVPLSGALLADLNERLKATIHLSVRQNGQILTEIRKPLIGLARNEWGGASHMPELLGAFVMPNDPAITEILKEAGDALRRAGEQPSLDGYQSRSRKKVWQIASAIWTAISAKRLVYAEPPASFETEGQKVRTPSEILKGGLATCLDTALLFAAALEQAGLYPIIAFTKGHALCGVWLQPQQLPALTVDDCVDIRKYIALKELALFETTMVTSEPPTSFSKAVSGANRQISEENEHQFIYALDIKQSRRHQITPLSTLSEKIASSEQQGGENVISLAVELAPDLPGFDLGIDDGPAPDTPETRLDHWKRKLLDLTKRNRLLNLKPSKTAIRLYCPDPATLEDKLADNKKITVIPLAKLSGAAGERDEDIFHSKTGEEFKKRFAEEALARDEIVADLPQNELDASLIQLYRKAKTDLQEGGANTLYLALGVLRWKQSEHETRIYRAPLILAPVKLERKSAASKVRLVQHEDEPVFNMTLLEMLRQDFSLSIPLLEGELPKDDSGINVSLIWEIVRKAIRDIPGFEVSEEVILSTFSFAKYLMWKDLADRTSALKQNPFVRHLIDHPRDPYKNSSSFIRTDEIDEKIDPKDLFMPLHADGSQIVAVHASSQGGDFILEGPPGTGKSQTISNIIAHNLALGKKVLFVSEKMAALEVVYNRLKQKGLGNFCLELHSNKANKKEILNQLGASWHSREIKAHSWADEAGRLKQIRDDLNTLVKALHTPHKTGISPRTAIGRTVRWQDEHRLKLAWPQGIENDRAQDKEGLENLKDIAKRLGQNFSELSDEDHKAFATVKQTNWSNAWQSNFVSAANKLIKSTDSLFRAQDSFCAEIEINTPSRSLSRAQGLYKIAQSLCQASAYNLEFCFHSDAQNLLKGCKDALSTLEIYNQRKQSVPYADEKIRSAPIEIWKYEWETAQSAIWPIKSIKEFFCARTIFKALGAAPSKASLDLKQIEELQNMQISMEQAVHGFPDTIPWKGLQTNIETAKKCLEIGQTLREGIATVATNTHDFANIKDKLKVIFVEGRELLQQGMPAVNAAIKLQQATEEYEQSLLSLKTEAQNINDETDNLEEIALSSKKIIELQPHINAWCRWQSSLKEAMSSGLEELARGLQNNVILPSLSQEAFFTAYCSWLSEQLIDDRQTLREFSAIAHEDKIKLYREIDQKVSDLTILYIQAKLSENIPHPDDTQRSSGYGVLNHELQKRMRHKPVRQLILEMGHALTTLTPCLLMSPLSVAQFLSADNQMFDLVVFDEASQITVWDAIGAIARGKNVIVVGDPKQMPPTSFFDRSASNDDDAEEDIEDLESILDEALAASVKLHRLTGHYRSRHESLIAFSNHRYYGGELITYPSADIRETAVSLINVNGTYQRGHGRTNPEEAKAIVKEIVRRLADPQLNRLSIGVIALNSEQQRLIDDLIDQERRQNPELERFFNDDAKEPVFVKNLETVQGDQRDVILLSIGYGPDVPGAKTMSMNFGPLNRKGGERRLNVAITRATSEMMIFASFNPSMIDLTRTSAQAVRDLKHYMEFAERGPSALGEAILHAGRDQYDSEFEESVAQGLRNLGWIVHTQVGVSKFRIDLAVAHPDNPSHYLAGIECDGMTYHSSPSARDRDRVRHAILESLKWKLLRIWSTDYFIDPKRTLDRVHQQLNEILKIDRERDASPKINNETPANYTTAESLQSLALFEEKQENTVSINLSQNREDNEESSTLSADKFYEESYQSVIRDYAVAIIDKIGPITFKNLTEKIARAHSFQRTGSQIRKTIWAAMSKERKWNKTPDGHTVLWPKDMPPQDRLDFRGLGINGEMRDWADVPYPEKLGLAYKIKSLGNIADPASAMAAEIGLGRLYQTTRSEFELLLNKIE